MSTIYTHRHHAVDHAAEVRKAGQEMCDEINKREDRNCISITSVVEQSMTETEKASAEFRSEHGDLFDRNFDK